jgi:hypothetical protein
LGATAFDHRRSEPTEGSLKDALDNEVVRDLIERLATEVSGDEPGRQFRAERRRREREAGVSHDLMKVLEEAFQTEKFSAQARRQALLGWLAQLNLLLKSVDVHSEIPQVLGRMIFDIDNGKVDPVWEANRGGSGFCLQIYELKKRAVCASELIRNANRQFLLTDAENEDKLLRRDRCHRIQADQLVWEHIQPLSAEKFQFKKEGAHVIDSWRRRLRALAQGNSIQGWLIAIWKATSRCQSRRLFGTKFSGCAT